MLRNLVSVFRHKIQPFGWLVRVPLLRRNIRKQGLLLKKLELDGEVLILAPHSDDEWIGCFPIIESFNCAICSMNMDGGDSEATKSCRFSEMEATAKKYKKRLLKVERNKTESLKRIIEEAKPRYIAVPFFIDWHEEHIETMKILKEALSDYDAVIICYQVSCPIPFRYVTHVHPLTKSEWIRKWKWFRNNYKTQRYFPWRRFACTERIEGAYSDSYAANVYCCLDSKRWKDGLYLLPPENDRMLLKKNINDIGGTFDMVNLVSERGMNLGEK